MCTDSRNRSRRCSRHNSTDRNIRSLGRCRTRSGFQSRDHEIRGREIHHPTAEATPTVEPAGHIATMESAASEAATAMKAATAKATTVEAATTAHAAPVAVPPPPPRAKAIVGEARPMDVTANNAIAVLCNIDILRQRYSSQPGLVTLNWESH